MCCWEILGVVCRSQAGAFPPLESGLSYSKAEPTSTILLRRGAMLVKTTLLDAIIGLIDMLTVRLSLCHAVANLTRSVASQAQMARVGVEIERKTNVASYSC